MFVSSLIFWLIFIVGNCRTLQKGEAPALSRQDQIPGTARTHHVSVCNDHQVAA